MKKLIFCVLLLTLPWQVSRASAADTPDNAAKIDKLMSQYADCCSFTGTVLVSDHDKVIFKKGYGLANREWNIPNTPEVKFRLGSITKQFTSMLIMQQVAKGSIRLDGHLRLSPLLSPGHRFESHHQPIAQPHVRHPKLYRRSQILSRRFAQLLHRQRFCENIL